MKINLFVKNAVILAATGLILRIAGVLFKVWLADTVKSEGIGLYSLVFSVYMLAATFATAGVSTAVTRLVAEEEHNGRKAVFSVMRKAVLITLLVAIVTTAIIFFLAEPIAVYILKDTRTVLALKILSFSLPFMGLSSCARGYFIARRKTVQPSAVQLLEQAVRIAVTVVTVKLFAHKGLSYTAAAVLLGDTLAEFVSFLVNWLLYRHDVKELPAGKSADGVLKRILHIALPITGSSYLSSALHTAENILIPLRLSLFYGDNVRGLELFGAVRGMALPLLFFPASFLTSLSTMLIPEVSEAKSLGNTLKVRETVLYAVKTTLTLSTLITCGFLFNAEDLGFAVYGDRDVGQIILILSPIVPLMYLESVTAGLLKGLDRQMNMLRFNSFDSIVRIASVFFLLPLFGIKAYLGIMIVSNCFTSCLSARCLFKTTETSPDLLRWVVFPLSVGVVGGILAKLSTSFINSTLIRLIVALSIQALLSAIYWFYSCKQKWRVVK